MGSNSTAIRDATQGISGALPWYLARRTITVHLDGNTNIYGLRSLITTNPNLIFIVHKNGVGDMVAGVIDNDNVMWR